MKFVNDASWLIMEWLKGQTLFIQFTFYQHSTILTLYLNITINCGY